MLTANITVNNKWIGS